MRYPLWVIGVLVLGMAVAAFAQAPLDTTAWTTLREDALGFELKHPPTWRVGRSTGTLESVLLGEPAQAGAARATMQILVQRGINPHGLTIEQWYGDQLKRFKVASPPPTTTTVIGGRRTIRRELGRADSRQYDFYTAVNTSDVFQVSISQPLTETRLDRVHDAVLSTITFLR